MECGNQETEKLAFFYDHLGVEITKDKEREPGGMEDSATNERLVNEEV